MAKLYNKILINNESDKTWVKVYHSTEKNHLDTKKLG